RIRKATVRLKIMLDETLPANRHAVSTTAAMSTTTIKRAMVNRNRMDLPLTWEGRADCLRSYQGGSRPARGNPGQPRCPWTMTAGLIAFDRSADPIGSTQNRGGLREDRSRP